MPTIRVYANAYGGEPAAVVNLPIRLYDRRTKEPSRTVGVRAVVYSGTYYEAYEDHLRPGGFMIYLDLPLDHTRPQAEALHAAGDELAWVCNSAHADLYTWVERQMCLNCATVSVTSPLVTWFSELLARGYHPCGETWVKPFWVSTD